MKALTYIENIFLYASFLIKTLFSSKTQQKEKESRIRCHGAVIVSNSLDRLAVSKINESSIDNSYCHIYVNEIEKRETVNKN